MKLVRHFSDCRLIHGILFHLYPVLRSISSGLFSSLPSIPPSTMITCPVTWFDKTGEARTMIWCAISNGLATFFSGVLESCSSLYHRKYHRNNRRTYVARARYTISGFDRASSAIGVRTHPGATQLALPFGAIFTISFFNERSRPYIIADS